MKPTVSTRTSQKLVSTDASSERFLEISIETPRAGSSDRAPLNLSIVIDRSGSMQGDKLARAKQAAEYILDHLTADDRVSIVTYDHDVTVIAPSRAATSDHIRRCRSNLREVQSGGTTALFDGWLVGCDQVADHIQRGTVSRTLLLTDGLANKGLADSPSICGHVCELFERGISTSAFGIGADFDEDLLSDMADAGHGQFYYIEHSGLIPDAFRKEFGDLASVVASKARLTLDVTQGVAAKLLGGIPHESTPGTIAIPVGDLYAGESRPYYLQLDVPAGPPRDEVTLSIRMNAEQDGRSIEITDGARFLYAGAEAVEAESVNEDVMRRVADVHIAEARIEAMKLNRAGAFKEASELMRDHGAKYRLHRPAAMVAEDNVFSEILESELDPVRRKMEKAEALRRSRVRRSRD